MPSDPCTNIGDGDIYGLGVRLGLYMLWASGFIVRLLGSWPRVSVIRTTNNILCGALILAEFIHLIDGSALSIDYLLSYHLTIVLFYAESYNLVRKNIYLPRVDSSAGVEMEIYRLYPDPSLIFQNLLFASYTIFGAWFWQVGVHGTQMLACDERAAIVFLFDLRSRSWTMAATVLASTAGAIFTFILLIHLNYLKRGVISGPELVFVRVMRIMSGGDPVSVLSSVLRPRPPKPHVKSVSDVLRFVTRAVHFALINLAGPAVAIVSVERMIHANKLQTPGIRESTGQMIALMTGATSFMVALWELYLEISKEVQVESSTPAEPHTGVPDSSHIPLRR